MSLLEIFHEKQKLEISKFKNKIKSQFSDKMELLLNSILNSIINFANQLENELSSIATEKSNLDFRSLFKNFDSVFEWKKEFGLSEWSTIWEKEKSKFPVINLTGILKVGTSLDNFCDLPKNPENLAKTQKAEKLNSELEKILKPAQISKTEKTKKQKSKSGFLSKMGFIFGKANPDGPIQAHLEEETEAVWDPIKKKYVFKGEPEAEEETKPKSPPKKNAISKKEILENCLSKTEQNVNALIKPPNLMKRRKDAKKMGTSASVVEQGSCIKMNRDTESLHSMAQDRREMTFLETVLEDLELQIVLKHQLADAFELLKFELIGEFNARKKSVDLSNFVKIEEHTKLVEEFQSENSRLKNTLLQFKKCVFEKIKNQNNSLRKLNFDREICLWQNNPKRKTEVVFCIIKLSKSIQTDDISSFNHFNKSLGPEFIISENLQQMIHSELVYFSEEVKNLKTLNKSNLTNFAIIAEKMIEIIKVALAKQQENLELQNKDKQINLIEKLNKTCQLFFENGKNTIGKLEEKQKYLIEELENTKKTKDHFAEISFCLTKIIVKNNEMSNIIIDEILQEVKTKLTQSNKSGFSTLKKIMLKLEEKKQQNSENYILC